MDEVWAMIAQDIQELKAAEMEPGEFTVKMFSAQFALSDDQARRQIGLLIAAGKVDVRDRQGKKEKLYRRIGQT